MDKVNLTDVAFLLVARFDSVQRLENALVVSEFLTDTFDTNVYLWEYDGHYNKLYSRLKPKQVVYSFCEDHDPILHRTRCINQMLDATTEPIVAVWDVDVIVPKEQVIEAVKKLREGADFAYPYEHYFYDTSEILRNLYIRTKDLGLLHQYRDFMNTMYAPNPVGGVFLARRDSYVNSGKENELFYGWGVEDGERYFRWMKNNNRIERIQGPLYHFTHPRGLNSRIGSQDDSITKKRLRLNIIKGTKWN